MSASSAPRQRARRVAHAHVVGLALALAGCTARESGPPGYPAQHIELPASAPSGESEKPDPSGARTFGWVAIAVGAEGAIAAAATSAAMLDFKSQRDAGCNAQKLCSSNGLNANAQIGSLAAWNAGAWILAGAGLGVGTFMLLTHPLDKERKTALTFAPDGTTAGLGLSGTF